jgi:hypothetical protein
LTKETIDFLSSFFIIKTLVKIKKEVKMVKAKRREEKRREEIVM